MDTKTIPRGGLIVRGPIGSDYIAGAATGILYDERMPGSDWSAYRPIGEHQSAATFDSMSCTNFSALNVIETQLNYLLANNLLPADFLTFLQKNGYMGSDGKPNFSDRYVAIMSGTTEKGNYLAAVWDAIRKFGLIPENMLPFGGSSTKEYLSPSAVTDDMIKLGRQVLYYLNFQYEWVMGEDGPTLSQALKQSPLQITIPSPIPYHAIELLSANNMPKSYTTFDSYDPFLIERTSDVGISYALKGYVSPIKHAPFSYVFTVDLSLGMTHPDVIQLQRFLNTDPDTLVAMSGAGSIGKETTYFGSATRAAVMRFQTKYGLVPVAGYFGHISRDCVKDLLGSGKYHESKIDAWCAAIKSREGFFAPGVDPRFPGGTPAWRNNNPGNIKYVGQSRATNTGPKDGSQFCVFRTYEDGYATLREMLVRACTTVGVTYFPDMTLLQFYKKYAPVEDQNDPASYASEVAKKLGVDVNIKIKELL